MPLQEFRTQWEVIVNHMYHLAMDPEFEAMFFTQQTSLKLEVVSEPHSDENAQRTVHSRTTGDESPSNYSEVRPSLLSDPLPKHIN